MLFKKVCVAGFFCSFSLLITGDSPSNVFVKIVSSSETIAAQQIQQYLKKSVLVPRIMFSRYGTSAAPTNFSPDLLQFIRIDPVNHQDIIAAYNGGFTGDSFFDVLIISDDTVVPAKTGYDKSVHDLMVQHFPDLDGIISFKSIKNDSTQSPVIAIGRKFYEKFGYIYHPHYKTSVAKKELLETATVLGKLLISDIDLFENVTSTGPKDKSSPEQVLDEETYRFRRQANFNLANSTNERIALSILIPTLENRRDMFEFIYNKLANQIRAAGLMGKVEILYNRDNGEKPTGQKRNELLQASRGEYTCFVDDDDDVSDDYIVRLYAAIKYHPDCLRLEGIITFDGKNPRLFIHSTAYTTFFEASGVYYRPPNHLNPIRHDIGTRFKFPPKHIGEDSAWAKQVCQSGLLKNELMPGSGPYYFYKYNGKHSVQTQIRE